MAYSLPPLPYAYDALEPHIDKATMEFHHDKHHQAYVTAVNAALEGTPLADTPIEEVMSDLSQVPADKLTAVKNNGGGHYNHTMFWENMSPDGGGEPAGALGDAITSTFGSFADFQAKIKETGIKQFGSGWSWLVLDGANLAIVGSAQPGQPDLRWQDAAARRRRLGARVLPQVPEPPPRLHRRVVERRRLVQGRGALQRRRLTVWRAPLIPTRTRRGRRALRRWAGASVRAGCGAPARVRPAPRRPRSERARSASSRSRTTSRWSLWEWTTRGARC